MKTSLAWILALTIFLSLMGCGSDAFTDPDVPATEDNIVGPVTPEDNASDETTKTDSTQSPSTDAEPESLPEETSEPWQWFKDTPEAQGLSSAVLDNVHAEFGTFPLLTSVIVKNGYIVDEYYQDGYDETSTFPLHSASKSVTSALVGIAMEEGYIDDLDTPIVEYLPQLADQEDAVWQHITIRHLLTHTTGIYSTDNELWNEWTQSDDWIGYILDLPIVSEPGEAFSYSTGNTHLLCAVLEAATVQTVYDFGKEVLFDPVGMDSVQCGTDPQGISDGGNGFTMSVYDMAKFGQLFLNGGVWQGEQIIPAWWVDESTSLQFERSTGTADYGYQWWVRIFGHQAYDAYFAQGHGGQYIFVVPDLALVIAFTSNYTGSTSIYWQLLNEIVDGCTETA